MGIKMKNDKLDLIASLFEGETLSNFDICCEDLEFRNMVIQNSSLPTLDIVSKLVDYANENLIWITLALALTNKAAFWSCLVYIKV